MSWSFQVLHYSPIFTNQRDITEHIVSFTDLTVAGNYDCIEGTFVAVPTDVEVELRDLIEIKVTEKGDEDVGGSRPDSTYNLFFGMVVEAGSPRDPTPQVFKIAGLSKRLKEAPTFTGVLAQKDVAAMAWEVAAYFPPGIIASAPNFPTQNFEVGETQLRHNTVGEVFDSLARTVPGFTVPPGETYTHDGVTYSAGDYVPPAKWGTRSDKSGFFRRDSRVLALTEGVEVDLVEYMPRANEQFYSMASVIFGSNTRAPKTYEVEDASLIAAYGKSVKRFAVSQEVSKSEERTNIWGGTLTGIVYERSTNGGVSWSTANEAQWLDALQDENPNTLARIRRTRGTSSTNQDLPVGMGYAFDKEIVGVVKGRVTRFATQWPSDSTPNEHESVNVFAITPGAWRILGRVPVGEEFEFTLGEEAMAVFVGNDGMPLDFNSGFFIEASELWVSKIGVDLIDRIARSYFIVPPEDKVELVSYNKYIEPTPRVNFTPRQGDPFEMDALEYRYSFSNREGFMTKVILGQALDADTRAQSELLKMEIENEGLAVIDWSVGK